MAVISGFSEALSLHGFLSGTGIRSEVKNEAEGSHVTVAHLYNEGLWEILPE